jgi:methyltransferase (TIGR00027 family)
MPIDYESAVNNLMQDLLFINEVYIIEGVKDIVFSTVKKDIEKELDRTINNWLSLNFQSIIFSGEKYVIRQCTKDRLVATSINGTGHIVGVKDEIRKILALIEPDGIIPFTTMELARTIESFRATKPYILDNISVGNKIQKMEEIMDLEKMIIDEASIVIEEKSDEDTGIPFTARLMAYYRALELKKESPLIEDPFAERLAGDLSSFMNSHIRYSEMDYPLVRSNYIENYLLTPWCRTQKRSQIILLGAGLDTRVYRFKPLQTNAHIVFEIDFPSIIQYKEEVLKDEKQLCSLVRLSLDLSNPDWTKKIIESGYSINIPTFWILEGLVYYMKQEDVKSLIAESAQISTNNSQIFVDIMQQSRWVSSSDTLYSLSKDPVSKHFKWGLDIKLAPSFFLDIGWDVSCSFADDYDQGRNVGQKAMIFIHGVRAFAT